TALLARLRQDTNASDDNARRADGARHRTLPASRAVDSYTSVAACASGTATRRRTLVLVLPCRPLEHRNEAHSQERAEHDHLDTVACIAVREFVVRAVELDGGHDDGE